MTSIKIKRLVITKDGRHVYDEQFSNKINIIRGENGSGKSTIANFIFFLLGGDFVEWLPEAKSCDFVLGEVEFDGKAIVIRRQVVDKIMQPMHIYYGNMVTALQSSIEGWLVYPYKKSENKESFSQLLFKILNFPEVTTENNESITLNQILRLLYIDQMSSLISFIKSVDFDSPLIRQAIGNLMLGTYDDILFNQQLELRDKRKKYNELKNEFTAARDVFKVSNQTIDINEIDASIKKNEEVIKNIDQSLLERQAIITNVKKNEVFDQIKKLQLIVELTSKEVSDKISLQGKTESELIDAENFIKELTTQNEALNESLSTRQLLGGLKVTYCPSCLLKLPVSDDPDVCELCKQQIADTDNKSRILRIQFEIQNQIKESKYLLEKRKEYLEKIKVELKTLKSKLRLENDNLNNYISSTNSTIDRKNDELLIRKGELSNQIFYLINQRQLLTHFLSLKTNLERLEKEIKNLEEVIELKEVAQRKNQNVALARIQYYALILIKGDGNYEAGFINANRIEIDFYKNLYYVDGRNNFSASSLVILKNSIRFGIFFASLELEFMRYPRFIICDNIEDKGMTEERSHNFQRNLVKLAKSISTDFQMILTTSMIDVSLEIPDYIVGEHYSPVNKSLKK